MLSNGLAIVILAAIVISFGTTAYASLRMETWTRFHKVSGHCGLQGSEVVSSILAKEGLTNVKVKRAKGPLTDYYDSKTKTILLSNSVYDSTSLAAVAVAASQAGHAIQDAEGDRVLRFRSALVPLVSFDSPFIWALILIGLIFNVDLMINLGVVLLLMTVIFHLVALSVESRANSRGLDSLMDYRMITSDEFGDIRKVLSANKFTHLAISMK